MSDSKGCFIILLVTRLVQIRSFTILLFAGETGIERPNSLFRDLAVRFDRVVWWRLCSKTIILVWDLHIAHVQELF